MEGCDNEEYKKKAYNDGKPLSVAKMDNKNLKIHPYQSYNRWCKDGDQENVYKNAQHSLSPNFKGKGPSIFSRLKNYKAYNETLILTYLGQFFSPSVVMAKVARKDSETKKTWFLDQDLITVLVAGGVERHGGQPDGLEKVEYGLKKVNRLDRGKQWGGLVGNWQGLVLIFRIFVLSRPNSLSL